MQVALWGAFLVGLLNFVFILVVGVSAARILTNDGEVVKQVSMVLPIIATFQHFDSLATTFNGFLRGLGKQAVGSLISISCYYVVALPVSFCAAFWLNWQLIGLWSGIAVALALLVHLVLLDSRMCELTGLPGTHWLLESTFSLLRGQVPLRQQKLGRLWRLCKTMSFEGSISGLGTSDTSCMPLSCRRWVVLVQLASKHECHEEAVMAAHLSIARDKV